MMSWLPVGNELREQLKVWAVIAEALSGKDKLLSSGTKLQERIF